MKGKFKIPSKFSLGGNDITVELSKDIKANDALGLWKYVENKIYIRTEFEGKKLNKDVMCHTFCHELAHAILEAMGEENLSANEKFVDLLGQFFCQFLKTSE